MARSLVTRKSNLIGVIVTDIGNSYIAQMVRGIEEVGRMYINMTSFYQVAYGRFRYGEEVCTAFKEKAKKGLILIGKK